MNNKLNNTTNNTVSKKKPASRKTNVKKTPNVNDVEKRIDSISKATIEPEVIEQKMGSVSDCTLLNVRKEADTDSEVLEIIAKGDKVSIIDTTSDYWFLIETSKKIRGYCMAKYISID